MVVSNLGLLPAPLVPMLPRCALDQHHERQAARGVARWAADHRSAVPMPTVIVSTATVDLHSGSASGTSAGRHGRPDVAQRHTTATCTGLDRCSWRCPCCAKLLIVEFVPIETRRRHRVREPTRVMSCPGYQGRSSETGLGAAVIADCPSRRHLVRNHGVSSLLRNVLTRGCHGGEG